MTSRKKSASDIPLDLAREREEFVRSFLKKGVEYTETLLLENTELREELDTLRIENLRLQAQAASDDAVRDLLGTIARLESERIELLARSSTLEEAGVHHESQRTQAEHDLNNLANLYIATFQLHLSLSPRRVVRHVRDMLGQLVGALGFVIYLIDDKSKKAVPLAFEGLEESDVQSIPLGMGPVGEACLTGLRHVREDHLHEEQELPVALIPLMVAGRPVGVVEVRTVLEQKNRWVSLDHELFELIATQSGSAMITANLYDDKAGPIAALEGFLEKQQR